MAEVGVLATFLTRHLFNLYGARSHAYVPYLTAVGAALLCSTARYTEVPT